MSLVDIICRRFAFSRDEFERYVNTCPYRYKTYYIDKRRGGRRKISQPSRDLKSVQRFLVEEFLEEKVHLHSAATAYRKGKSIVDNASPHAKNQYLLKMDLKDFFPSILAEDFINYAVNNGLAQRLEANVMAKIFLSLTINCYG